MAQTLHFRSALNGFNRQDVVSYIEYINNQHAAQVAQLNTQLQTAPSAADSDLRSQLDAALARCAELEAQLQQLTASEEAPAAPAAAEPCAELEAYRRAERTERMARERAAQIYDQANAVLADVTAKVEAASQAMAQQLQACQSAAADATATLHDAVVCMYAIRPEEE